MSIEIQWLDGDRERWDRGIEQSPQGSVLHEFDALSVQATYSKTSVVPLVGYKGEELVGLFPLFSLSKGPITAVFSPPPNLWIQKLGPAFLNLEKLKQRKAERRRRRFIDGVFEWLREEFDPKYVRFRTSERLTDPRPFNWNACDVTPGFTYVIDLRCGADELLERFSSDARRNIRNADGTDYTITTGDGDDIDRLMEQVRRRYEAQDEPFHVPSGFPRALYERLPDGRIRPFILRIDEEFIGGILTYDDGETVGRWYGGVKPDESVDIPINDLLDWAVMRDAIDRGRSFYDLVGAGDPRLNQYKSKFSPQLSAFYHVERTSAPVRYLIQAYRTIRNN